MQLIRHGGRCIISCATDVSPAGTNGWLPSARHNRTTREPLPGAKQPMEIPCLWKLYSDARHPCQIFRPVHWPTRGAHCRPLDPRLASSLLKFLHKCKSRKRGLDTSAVMGAIFLVHPRLECAVKLKALEEAWKASARARQKGPPLPPSPSHRPQERRARADATAKAEGARGSTNMVFPKAFDVNQLCLRTQLPDEPSFCTPVLPRIYSLF